MTIVYTVDGVDLKTYGVYVEASEGLLSRPKKKKPFSNSWDNYHGDVVDLTKVYYDTREITLDCFIKSPTKALFITACNTFLELFDKPGMRRLSVSVDGSEPLLFEVYSDDTINIKKKWSDSTMVGKLQLKLKEPEPVKKVIKFERTSDATKRISVSFTSSKLLNLYWGDTSHSFDQDGRSGPIIHDYLSNGVYYLVITGDIDAITSLTTNGTVIWSKL